MNAVNKLRSVLLITLVIFISSTYGYANEPASTKTKEVNQTYSVGKNDLLSVDNSYGSIVISHWNKSEISIRVIVEAHSRNENRAKELLDRVNIEINKSGNKVSAVTSLKKFNTNNNEHVTITYMISMPSSMQNRLSQKYGDIIMPEKNEGSSQLEMRYGNIKAGSFTKDLVIDAQYGNIILGNLSKAKMDLAYCGKVEIKDANEASIESKYSNIEAQDISNIKIECSYGGLRARNIVSAYLDFRYSNATIESIAESLIAENLSYGTLNVNELSSNFKQFNTSARYGNINIRISSKASFKVEAENMRYGNLDINGFNPETRKEGHNIYSTVNGGGKGRVIRMDGGSFSNLKINTL